MNVLCACVAKLAMYNSTLSPAMCLHPLVLICPSNCGISRKDKRSKNLLDTPRSFRACHGITMAHSWLPLAVISGCVSLMSEAIKSFKKAQVIKVLRDLVSFGSENRIVLPLPASRKWAIASLISGTATISASLWSLSLSILRQVSSCLSMITTIVSSIWLVKGMYGLGTSVIQKDSHVLFA